jgi:hypothetical protein
VLRRLLEALLACVEKVLRTGAGRCGCAVEGLGYWTPPAQVLGDEVAGSVLELLAPGGGDAAWHGACLALAELARRGLLPPGRLLGAAPRIAAALRFDARRGAHRRARRLPARAPWPQGASRGACPACAWHVAGQPGQALPGVL